MRTFYLHFIELYATQLVERKKAGKTAFSSIAGLYFYGHYKFFIIILTMLIYGVHVALPHVDGAVPRADGALHYVALAGFVVVVYYVAAQVDCVAA